uniref:Hyphal_reg_CWP domain-containing protein n=1 Tax=Haemonchus contortus TaxID=6289 RepID=A0A7I4YKD8_HAECO
MRFIFAFSLIFLIATQDNVYGFWPFDYGEDASSNDGIFGWCRSLLDWIENLFKSVGDSDVIVNSGDGVTNVSAVIGGKRHNATFPGADSISSSSSIVNINGNSTEVFNITVNGTTYYTYKTVDGETSLTKNGKEDNSDDPFHVISHETTSSEPQTTPVSE